MFQKSYQLLSAKSAGRGTLVREAGACLPWCEMFRPRESWRPMVLIAAAAEQLDDEEKAFHRPVPAVRSAIALRRRKKRADRLQGVQLNLFLDVGDPNFYRPSVAPNVATEK